jgi:hypothetical protein
MEELLNKAIKDSYPAAKIDHNTRLSSGNKKFFIIRGIDKDREKAFQQLQDLFKNLKITYEVKELKSASKNFPYVITVNFGSIVYTTKPDVAGRVISGSGAQDKFADFVKQLGAINVKTAKTGSQEADVSFSINGKLENAEIKNSSNLKDINAFDITIYRKDKKSSASKDLTFINELIEDFTGFKTIEEYINDLRKIDQTIGYSGDEGVKNKSGNLPTKYFKFGANDRAVKTLKDHWQKDDYFVITTGNKFVIYNTNGVGALTDIIKRQRKIEIETFNRSSLKEIKFQTYGGTRPGTIRMQLSITLNSATTVEYNSETL